MCSRCWSSVPMSLQREVNRTWRIANKAFIDAPAWKPYYAARTAAIEAAKGGQHSLGLGR